MSWLFSGEVEHRDTTGVHALVRPGELNIMTAGSGIAHSEHSTSGTTVLHGVQLWVALPAAQRFVGPGFEHYAPPVLALAGARARVFLGTLFGEVSPGSTYSPLVGAQVVLAAGTSIEIAVDPGHEHGILCDTGAVALGPATAVPGELLLPPAGASCLRLTAGARQAARFLLPGGEPFGEQILMWWNLIGRTHEEIVAFRDDWQRERAAPGGAGALRKLP